MGTSKKRINPNRKPMSYLQAISKAREDAVVLVWTIFFTVLKDKENLSNEHLKKVWDECVNLSDSIARGYVNVKDLQLALKTESGINLVGKITPSK